MASSEAYAAWIVKNKDKKGTPEFQIVADAYADSMKRPPVQASTVESTNPTNDNSFLQNYHAGLGHGVANAARSVGQLARYAMPDRAADALGLPDETSIDEAQKRDAPLLSTVGGFVGSMAGNIAATAIPGMAAAKYGKAIPVIGKAVAGLGEMVTTPKGLMPNIAGGAVMGATQPVGTDDSRLTNAAVGGAAGGLLPAAATLYGAGKFATNVWSKKYGEELAGNLINNETSLGAETLADRIRQGATSKIKGYEPTLAESLSSGGKSDIGIATLQRAMQSVDPTGTGAKFAVQDRTQSQNKALLHSLNKHILPDSAYQHLEDVRRGATKDIYNNLPLVQSSGRLESILGTPGAKEAIPFAKKIAGNEYRTFGEEIPNLKTTDGHAFPDLNSLDMSATASGVANGAEAMQTHWTQQPINYQTDNMMTAIRKMGGINKDLVQSTYENRAWEDGLGHGLFRNNGGQSIDDLASRLAEHGYLPENAGPYDVMNALYDKSAGDTFSHMKNGYDDIYSPDMTESDTLTQSIGRLIDQLEKKSAPKAAKIPAEKVAGEPARTAEDMAYQGRDLQMLLKGMKANIQGMDAKQLKRSYGGPLSDLTDHLNAVMPELQDANRLYAQHSKPLNQSDIFSALMGTENKALVGTANAKLNEGQFLRLLDNPKALLRQAGDLEGVTSLDRALSNTGKRTLKNMKETIRNRASSNSDASALGSPTAQNLSTGRAVANNMVESALLNLGIPKKYASNKLIQSIIDRPSSWAFKIPEEGVRENIARSLIDPNHAAALSEMAIEQMKKRAGRKTTKALKYQLPVASSLASYLTQQ